MATSLMALSASILSLAAFAFHGNTRGGNYAPSLPPLFRDIASGGLYGKACGHPLSSADPEWPRQFPTPGEAGIHPFGGDAGLIGAFRRLYGEAPPSFPVTTFRGGGDCECDCDTGCLENCECHCHACEACGKAPPCGTCHNAMSGNPHKTCECKKCSAHGCPNECEDACTPCFLFYIGFCGNKCHLKCVPCYAYDGGGGGRGESPDDWNHHERRWPDTGETSLRFTGHKCSNGCAICGSCKKCLSDGKSHNECLHGCGGNVCVGKHGPCPNGGGHPQCLSAINHCGEHGRCDGPHGALQCVPCHNTPACQQLFQRKSEADAHLCVPCENAPWCKLKFNATTKTTVKPNHNCCPHPNLAYEHEDWEIGHLLGLNVNPNMQQFEGDRYVIYWRCKVKSVCQTCDWDSGWREFWATTTKIGGPNGFAWIKMDKKTLPLPTNLQQALADICQFVINWGSAFRLEEDDTWPNPPGKYFGKYTYPPHPNY